MAVGQYTIDLDIPYSELHELGWTKIRMLRNAKASKLIKPSDKVVIEPKTGTLMLKPIQLPPIAELDLDYNSEYWQKHPENASVIGFDPSDTNQRHVMRSKGFLLDMLESASIIGVQMAIIQGSKTLTPVLATSDPFPANQCFSVRTTFTGAHNNLGKDWMAVRFGDFLLSLSVDGTADLYWSTDGSCDEDTWEHRKTFNNIPDMRDESITGVGIGPLSSVRIDILPIGKGHIWFRMRAPGFTFNDVYTHPESTATNGLYSITAAGKVVVLVPSNEEKSVDVQICPLGFATEGMFRDITWELPYRPTMEPQFSSNWTTTMGTPAVSYNLRNDDPGDWISDGLHNKIQPWIILEGDGTCTPFLDYYQLRFPEKIVQFTPETINVPADAIMSLGFADGEDWDNQTIDITIKDDGTNPDIRDIAFRSEISARLNVDGVARAVFLCKQPKIETGIKYNLIHLSGQNFGFAKIKAKKYFFPKSYGGMTHPDTIKENLMNAGFPSTDIVIDEDIITLPNSESDGTGANDTVTETIKSQPQFNSSMADFLKWVVDNFSRWPLRFNADMKWYYQAPPAEQTSTVVFEDDGPDITTWNPWIGREKGSNESSLVFEVEPPEANVLYLFGQADDGTIIANYAVDSNSIDTVLDPKPINYIGRMKPLVVIDSALPTQEILDACLLRMFNAVRQAIIWANWRGPFVPDLKIDDYVTLENFGLVQLKSMQFESQSARVLERSASTGYRGILVEGYPEWFPILGTYEYVSGRNATIRKRFLDELNDRINRAGGKDIYIASATTAQKFDQAAVLDQILRGEVKWGTPIEIVPE